MEFKDLPEKELFRAYRFLMKTDRDWTIRSRDALFHARGKTRATELLKDEKDVVYKYEMIPSKFGSSHTGTPPHSPSSAELLERNTNTPKPSSSSISPRLFPSGLPSNRGPDSFGPADVLNLAAQCKSNPSSRGRATSSSSVQPLGRSPAMSTSQDRGSNPPMITSRSTQPSAGRPRSSPLQNELSSHTRSPAAPLLGFTTPVQRKFARPLFPNNMGSIIEESMFVPPVDNKQMILGAANRSSQTQPASPIEKQGYGTKAPQPSNMQKQSPNPASDPIGRRTEKKLQHPYRHDVRSTTADAVSHRTATQELTRELLHQQSVKGNRHNPHDSLMNVNQAAAASSVWCNTLKEYEDEIIASANHQISNIDKLEEMLEDFAQPRTVDDDLKAGVESSSRLIDLRNEMATQVHDYCKKTSQIHKGRVEDDTPTFVHHQ